MAAQTIRDLPIREVSKDTRRHILLTHGAGPAFAVAFALPFIIWGVTAWGEDAGPTTGEDQIRFLSSVALLVAAPIWAWYFMRRALLLAKRGVEVMAQVVYVSSVSKNNLVGIRYAFTFQGVRVEKQMSVLAGEFKLGSGLMVLADPINPRHCLPKDEVFRPAQH